MELSNVSINSLNILLNSNIVSDEDFDELLLGCQALTINEKCKTKIPGIVLGGVAYGNIVGLLIEAARHKYDREHFDNFLRTSKIFQGSRVEKLSATYEKYREQLISHLTSVGNHFPCIVDVNWKLDYCIKRSTNNFDIGCMYHIRLIVKKYGEINNIQFTCTRHQLQELIYKLREIVRHVEKISHT